jgi:catechol 2,3-dioxygenase-like lactoylglutathione lyase family enzyme
MQTSGHVALVVRDYDEALAFFTNQWDPLQLKHVNPRWRAL